MTGQKITPLKPGTQVLLSVLVYNDCAKKGPPHSVNEAEVRRLYDGAQIELVERCDMSEGISPPWREAGMTSLESELLKNEL